jgi:hypothetical protein
MKQKNQRRVKGTGEGERRGKLIGGVCRAGKLNQDHLSLSTCGRYGGVTNMSHSVTLHNPAIQSGSRLGLFVLPFRSRPHLIVASSLSKIPYRPTSLHSQPTHRASLPCHACSQPPYSPYPLASIVSPNLATFIPELSAVALHGDQRLVNT